MAKKKVSAKDVASEVFELAGKVTAMKLQKLVYYCQAWSLVWDENPLFAEKIEAWANGPIIPELYALHRGKFIIEKWKYGSVDNLNNTQKKTIKSVVNFYSKYTSQQLSEITHSESPWKDARKGLAPGERGSNIINDCAMAEYYSSL